MYKKDLSFNFQKRKCNFIVLCEFFQGCGIRRLGHLFLLPRAVLPATERRSHSQFLLLLFPPIILIIVISCINIIFFYQVIFIIR